MRQHGVMSARGVTVWLLLATAGLGALDSVDAVAAERSGPPVTAGTGTIDGHAWSPRVALAGRDGFGDLVIDFLPERGGCNDIFFAKNVIELLVLGGGKPVQFSRLPLGKPVNPGHPFVLQANFRAAGLTRYPAQQPGVALTLISVHGASGTLTTGHASVAPFRFRHAGYALNVTFSARWCSGSI
jgi:hypothetical protein